MKPSLTFEVYIRFYYQHDPTQIATCPIMIHVLLHIADSIKATGPVWTSWAFPMERFCGSLQPAIKSQCHPYMSISKHVTDKAHLTQVQVLYDLQDQLSLQASPCSGQLFAHPKCMLHCISNISSGLTSLCYTIDPTCILLPPQATTCPEPSLLKKVIAALATRYDTLATNVQHVCSAESMQTWGKVR